MNAIGTRLRDPINSVLTRWRRSVQTNKRTPPRNSGGIPLVSTRFNLSMEMSRLARDGTAEPVSRDQILWRERGQGDTNFPSSLLLLYVITLHTFIQNKRELVAKIAGDHRFSITTPVMINQSSIRPGGFSEERCATTLSVKFQSCHPPSCKMNPTNPPTRSFDHRLLCPMLGLGIDLKLKYTNRSRLYVRYSSSKSAVLCTHEY